MTWAVPQGKHRPAPDRHPWLQRGSDSNIRMIVLENLDAKNNTPASDQGAAIPNLTQEPKPPCQNHFRAPSS